MCVTYIDFDAVEYWSEKSIIDNIFRTLDYYKEKGIITLEQAEILENKVKALLDENASDQEEKEIECQFDSWIDKIEQENKKGKKK
jgi:flagellar motor component MotA